MSAEGVRLWKDESDEYRESWPCCDGMSEYVAFTVATAEARDVALATCADAVGEAINTLDDVLNYVDWNTSDQDMARSSRINATLVTLRAALAIAIAAKSGGGE